MSPTVHGYCEPRFERVRQAFLENFTDRDELGAAVCVMLDGEAVVDLWGGVADVATARPWRRDTLVVMFSATKGLVALAFLMLQDRGVVDLDAPVARWWPDFAQAGKADVTVRTLLNHRAGLSAVDAPIELSAFANPAALDDLIAAQAPAWEPGTDQGYGATAWGIYAGALFRHIAGETVGTFLRREVFEPLGADVHLGVQAAEQARIATLYPVPASELARNLVPALLRGGSNEARIYGSVLRDRKALPLRAITNPKLGPKRLGVLNEPETLTWELPWMGAVGTARGVATVYAPLAQGGRAGEVALVRPQALTDVVRRQVWSWSDQTVLKPLGFSQGFMKEEPHLFSPNEASFGHPGAGGALGWADPTHRMSIGYVMNRMDHRLRSPRTLALCHATYRALGYG